MTDLLSLMSRRLEKKLAQLRTPGPPTPAVSTSGGPAMNLVTQAVVRSALAPWPTPMLPAAFATAVLARALAEHGIPSPIRVSLDGRSLAAEAKRLKAWTADPGPGYLWLAPWLCGVVVGLSGATMDTVDSDGRVVARARRQVSEATLGFLDPGMLVSHG